MIGKRMSFARVAVRCRNARLLTPQVRPSVRCWRFGLVTLLLLPCALAPQAVRADDDGFFERNIRPVLAGTCFKCHGGERTSNKLRVDSRAALLKGGRSGPAVVPGAPEKSLLLQALNHDKDVHPMPPDKT